MTDLFNRAYLGRSPEGHILYDPSVLPDHGLGLMMPPSPGVQTNIAEDGSDDELIRMLTEDDRLIALDHAEVDTILRNQTRLIQGASFAEGDLPVILDAVDQRHPLTWQLAWGSQSGWPRWTASVATGTGGLIAPRVLVTNAHVVAGKSLGNLFVELGEYAWTVSKSKSFPYGGGHNTRLLHPPIPVTAVVRPPWSWGLHHLDWAFVVLAYEPQISTMMLSASVPPGTFAGDPGETPKKAMFSKFVDGIDPNKPWGHFDIATYIGAFCGTPGGMLGGRVWNPDGPEELQASGNLGNPDYQTFQALKILDPVGVKDGGMLVCHTGFSTGGMSGSPIVKLIDGKFVCVGVNVGRLEENGVFASGPAFVLGAGYVSAMMGFAGW